MGHLTFEEFSRKNRERCRQWHEGDTIPWTGADWSNAMCGEAGEAANVVKKLRRIETGTQGSADPERTVLISQLADELHDVIAYADLLAEHYGIDFEKAQVDKFDRVSRREGFPQLLGDETPTPAGPDLPVRDMVRIVMADATPGAMSPKTITAIIRDRWPERWALPVVDVAEAMRSFYVLP